MDDLGNLLQSNPRNGGFGLFFHSSGTFPDEWTAEISFPGPHSRARKLRWVEGDLMVYRVCRRHHVDFRLPAADADLGRQGGVAAVRLMWLDGGVPTFEPQVDTPAGSSIRPATRGGAGPLLLGASGRFYTPSGGSTSSSGGPDGTCYRVQGQFQ